MPYFPSISLSNIPIEEEEEHESYIIFNLTFIPILLDCKPIIQESHINRFIYMHFVSFDDIWTSPLY